VLAGKRIECVDSGGALVPESTCRCLDECRSERHFCASSASFAGLECVEEEVFMITERLLGTALRCIEFFEDAFETILLLEWCSCAELHVRFLACRRGRISGEHYGAPSRVVV
jgi:hypothetical protein